MELTPEAVEALRIFIGHLQLTPEAIETIITAVRESNPAPVMTRQEYLENVERYNLVITPAGLSCLGCGMKYPSLEDRMLMELGPGGCSGCIQKTKWGG